MKIAFYLKLLSALAIVSPFVSCTNTDKEKMESVANGTFAYERITTYSLPNRLVMTSDSSYASMNGERYCGIKQVSNDMYEWLEGKRAGLKFKLFRDSCILCDSMVSNCFTLYRVPDFDIYHFNKDSMPIPHIVDDEKNISIETNGEKNIATIKYNPLYLKNELEDTTNIWTVKKESELTIRIGKFNSYSTCSVDGARMVKEDGYYIFKFITGNTPGIYTRRVTYIYGDSTLKQYKKVTADVYFKVIE